MRDRKTAAGKTRLKTAAGKRLRQLFFFVLVNLVDHQREGSRYPRSFRGDERPEVEIEPQSKLRSADSPLVTSANRTKLRAEPNSVQLDTVD